MEEEPALLCLGLGLELEGIVAVCAGLAVREGVVVVAWRARRADKGLCVAGWVVVLRAWLADPGGWLEKSTVEV